MAFTDENHHFAVGLKFIRWTYFDKTGVEFKKGLEVEIIEVDNNMCTVRLGENNYLIPQWCFYPRHKVILNYTCDQFAIKTDEIVGVIEFNGSNYKIRTADGIVGEIPSDCLYDFVKEQGGTHGDQSHSYAGGLKFVRWGYTAERDCELTVDFGHEVEIIQPGSAEKCYLVKLDGKNGLIPEKCFYPRQKVKFVSRTDQGIQLHDIVGVVGYNKDKRIFKIIMNNGDEREIPETYLFKHARGAREVMVSHGTGYQPTNNNEPTRLALPVANGTVRVVTSHVERMEV